MKTFSGQGPAVQMSTNVQPVLEEPKPIHSEEALDDLLTRPRAELVEFIGQVRSPLVIVGAGGKMGPTLAALARRAADQAGHKLKIVCVSRFGNLDAKRWLEDRAITTISCDLLDRQSVSRLPDSENVLYLAGLKFGTEQNPALTWATNTLAPIHVAEHYRHARIVALSTGNVYPLSPVAAGGSVETDPLTPLGEYGNAAIARERLFQYFSARNSTPMTLLRLFYAVEPRYGVVRDLADKIWLGQKIQLANGWFNCIWQGDANEIILRSLRRADCPPNVFNLTRPELIKVRSVAERLGQLLRKPVQFDSWETETALLGNAAKLCAEMGLPPTSLETIVQWTAGWVQRGGRSFNRPTHFETRDGKY